MAHGENVYRTSLLGIPFIIVGIYLYFFRQDMPEAVAYPFLGFGIFIVLTGIYVYFRATPDAPTLRNGEEIVVSQHPVQRVALLEVILGAIAFIGTLYLLLFTFRPYIYPTVSFLVGLYLFSSGLYTYWANSVTTYYVTNQRVIREYRFLSLNRQEISLEKIRGVEERVSIVETLVGLGNVYIASGGGSSLEIEIKNIKDSSGFADKLRSVS